MNRLGVITGLVREAECLPGYGAADGPRVRCSGADAARARGHAQALIAEGCRGLVSFGTAGGLEAGLAAGTLIVADRVVTPGGRAIATAAQWRQSLLSALAGDGAVRAAAIAGSDVLVPTPEAKRALAERTGAVAVDMESHAVAEAAAEAGVPFLVVRAVSDPEGKAIPEWIAATVGADGRTRTAVVMAALLTRPGSLPRLLELRRDSAVALAALRRVAGLAGPGFGLA